MERLLKLIEDQISIIRSIISTTDKNWNSLIGKLKKYKNHPNYEILLNDEALLTFLLSLPYAEKKDYPSLLFEKLTGKQANHAIEHIWIEALPMPPREREGNTSLDLALGSIHKRDETENGIEYLKNANSQGQVLFCEMKWESDLSLKITYDLKRNQMARIMENLLAFQDSNGEQPDQFFFTLVTPEIFKKEHERVNGSYSRFYGYKFRAYEKDSAQLLADLDEADPKLPKRNNGWKYPTERIGENLHKLRMNWLSYEEIIEAAPENGLKKEVSKLFETSELYREGLKYLKREKLSA